jgi:hypothetical protein
MYVYTGRPAGWSGSTFALPPPCLSLGPPFGLLSPSCHALFRALAPPFPCLSCRRAGGFVHPDRPYSATVVYSVENKPE